MMEFALEWSESDIARCIPFKSYPDQRCFDRIRNLRLSCADVQISDRSRHGIDALTQSAVDTLLSFAAQVANVIGRHNCLNVGGEPPAAGSEIQGFISEMDFHPLIY